MAYLNTIDDIIKLRQRTLKVMKLEVNNRKLSRKLPNWDEFMAGAYIEQLEPIVRDAILVMRRKGYNTNSSGFWGIGDPKAEYNFTIEWVNRSTAKKIPNY